VITDIKTENQLRQLAGLPLKEAEAGSLDNIIAKHREAFESVMRGDSSLYDHDEFYDELYEHYVSSGEMPYGIAKARDGDPDQWIQEELDREYGDDFATDDGEPMDGDFDSAMASAGMGTDEDYGYYGEGKSHSCATHVEHKEFGKGQCIPTQHSLIETDNGEYKVTHYDIKFGSGIKKNVPVEKLKIIKESHHKHKKAKVVEENKEPKTFREHLDKVIAEKHPHKGKEGKDSDAARKLANWESDARRGRGQEEEQKRRERERKEYWEKNKHLT
jgi:hypothetical protein